MISSSNTRRVGHALVGRTRLPRRASPVTNVAYVIGGGPQQQIDLYIPTNCNGEALVVYVHGGGWERGDKAGDSINPKNLQWLWRGYAMASINYRLAPFALWPAQIQDCKAAIRWLKAHADQYGYDPNRIAVVVVLAKKLSCVILQICLTSRLGNTTILLKSSLERATPHA